MISLTFVGLFFSLTFSTSSFWRAVEAKARSLALLCYRCLRKLVGGSWKCFFIGIYFTAFLPATLKLWPNLLLNWYVCAFSAVRGIAQWDRYRILDTSQRERANKPRERSAWKMREREWERGGIAEKSVEWIFPQALFSVRVWVFVIQVAPVVVGADVRPCKSFMRDKHRRQSKCEFCVLLSEGLFYEIN